MSRFRIGCLGAAAVFIICFALFLNAVISLAKVGKESGSARRLPKFEEKLIAEATETAAPGATSPKIVVLNLRGVISSSELGTLGETMVDDLKMQLNQALRDNDIKAIVLQIDSPGGEVTASDLLYRAVLSAKEKKPIVIYMNSVAASGGYYIACGGTHLMASETTMTGSIGVIMQSFNYAALFDKYGLKFVTLKSGKFKDLLSGSRENTPEELAYVQGMVDQSYARFLGIVAKARQQDAEALKNSVADGRVLSGQDAFDAKLIDSLGTIEDAYAKAMELGQAPGAAVVRYEADFQLGRLFQMLGESKAKPEKVEVNLTEGWLPKLQAGRLYFLPAFAAP